MKQELTSTWLMFAALLMPFIGAFLRNARTSVKVSFVVGCLALAVIGANAAGWLPDYVATIEIAALAAAASVTGGAVLAAFLIRRHARAV